MCGRGPQAHKEFVGIYSVPQTDAGTNTTVTTECVLPAEPTSAQVSQIVLPATLLDRERVFLSINLCIHDIESRAVSPNSEGHAFSLTVSGMLKQCTVKDLMSTLYECITLVSIRPRYITSNQ